MKKQSLLALTMAITTLGTTGCGTIVDITYLAGSKHFDKSVEERKPTGQVNVAIEYESTITPEGNVQLICEERERQIERTFSVHKTYEYRGGYESGAYIATAVLSGLAAAGVAGFFAIACNIEPQPGQKDFTRFGCINALYATPFGVDMTYSIIRAITAKKPKLIDKKRTDGPVRLAEVPSQKTPVACDSIEKVALGEGFSGYSDDYSSNSTATLGRIYDGAIPIAVQNGTISLGSQPEVVHKWATNSGLSLWVMNRNSEVRQLNVDRCKALRPFVAIMTPQELMMFNGSCPVAQAQPGATPPTY